MLKNSKVILFQLYSDAINAILFEPAGNALEINIQLKRTFKYFVNYP